MFKSRIPGEQCPACLASLLEQAVAGCGLAGEAEVRLRAQMQDMCDQGLEQGRVPSAIATEFFALARKKSGVVEQFAAKKTQDFEEAAKAVASLGPVANTFAQRARVAIMGNAIDHFFLAETAGLWNGGISLELGVDQLALAEERLGPGARVVMLADNCGEQSFDRLLVEHLMDRGCQVDYVVKAGPVQNDVTLEDLERAGQAYGLGRIRNWAPAAVGLKPGSEPPELKDLLVRADLVIAKGMGHFESLAISMDLLIGKPSPWPLLLLFIAKCIPVSQSLGIQKGQGAALFFG